MATMTGVEAVMTTRWEHRVMYREWFGSEPEARAYLLGLVAAHGVPLGDLTMYRDGGALVCRVEDHWLDDEG
jgi:hypothetical protein